MEGQAFWDLAKNANSDYALRASSFFQDSMVDGPFSVFRHDHIFDSTGSGTMMTDHIEFCSPVPFAGELLDRLVIRKHLQDFVEERNKQLKAAAESDLWRQYLSTQNQ